MRIGIDFDNTIANYTGVFHRFAVADGLIPESIPTDKNSVRDYLRSEGREDDWTKLQGEIYGRHLDKVPPYDGVIAFMRDARYAGHDVFIISHKTKHPYAGPAYDMHLAARQFLDVNKVFDGGGAGLPSANAFFELTLHDKLARIGTVACNVFIDDLPEFLAEPAFPNSVQKILFDPHNRALSQPDDVTVLPTWASIGRAIL